MNPLEELWKQYGGGVAAPTQQKSQAAIDAENALATHNQNRPGEYQSQYSQQIADAIAKLNSRPKFSYDANSDPLFGIAKENYMKMGQQASRDVGGQISAMTGGYGNSYAATAGNQAYQNAIGQINDIIPGLQQNAANLYNQQGADMANQLSMLQNQDSAAAGQFQQGVQNYYAQLQALQQQYDNAYGADQAAYDDAFNAWQANESLAFQKAQAAQQQENYDAEHAPKKGGGGGGGSKGGYSNAQYKRALYLYDEYGEDKAKAYIKQLGLGAEQEAALMREVGVYSRQSSNGANAGYTPKLPDSKNAPYKNLNIPLLPPNPIQQAIQQRNMQKYLDQLQRPYR